MKPEALAKWEKTRSAGKARFILTGGLLSWGLPMFIVMTFIVHREDLSPAFIAISAALWSAGGALFGAVMWHLTERQYRKALRHDRGATRSP